MSESVPEPDRTPEGVADATTSAPADADWAAGPAWELLLPAVAGPTRSRGVKLMAALREAIRDGRLVAGTRLPSSRDLAADLRVSRGLVTEVYAQLLAESYLVARPGAGTWVAQVHTRQLKPAVDPSREYRQQPSPESPAAPAGVAARAGAGAGAEVAAGGGVAAAARAGAAAAAAGEVAVALAVTARSHRQPVEAHPAIQPGARDVIDFRPGVPALAMFPRSAWAAAYQRAVTTVPDLALGYPDPRGVRELRVAVAEMLARRRGVAVHEDSLLICSGVSQALTLLARVAAHHGHRTVAVEDPGSPPEIPLLEDAGLRAIPVAVDDSGIDMRALMHSGTRMFVGTPAHQFPTGIAYTPERRAALLGWARENRGLIVEDDYDGEFRYDRAPVGAMQGLGPDQVAYTGSVSKSLAPGLRLGWLVPPPALYDDLVEAKRVSDLGNAAPDQAALADFIRTGRYDQHLRRCQRTYRDRRDALRSALARELPDVRVVGIAAGLHLIAQFPPTYGPASAIAERAARAGVRLHPVDGYAIGSRPAAGPTGPTGSAALARPAAPAEPVGQDESAWARIVLGYANLTGHRIADAVTAMAPHLRARTEPGRR
ncbi:MAG TPA: PLP-dependent aminotransferase family protein [Actinocrinis sp.]|nr:PLP-dependent aminotransferase family protein [Actinocrinis sp.]